MRQLLELAAQLRPPQLQRFIDGGGKVVGYSCVSTPRELLDAAGVLPYRIRALGGTAKELADARMSRFNCSFCRSCLQLALDGSFDFFDGLIETNGCDHLRGMFENWQAERPAPGGYFHYLRVPHLKTAEALAAYTDELRLLRQSLADHFGAELDDDALRAAMARQQRLRDKLRRVQALRQANPPALGGAGALALSLLESTLPPPDFEQLLDRLLEQLARRPALPPHRARLLLCGSATDELSLVQQMEATGALFVVDGLCYGARAAWPAKPASDRDPLAALARGYLEGQLCPRMFDDYPARLQHFVDIGRGAGVHGAVLVHNKFCDLHGVDNVQLRRDLEREGIPVLLLEKEYGAGSDEGRIQTRLQAFMERIGR